MTAKQAELVKWLELLRNCCTGNNVGKRFHYKGGPADLLLQHGRWYTPQPLPTQYRLGETHACFRNAAIAAMISEGLLRYVEGYATNIIPTHHGWCADREGNVYEMTWRTLGTAYFGIEFPPAKVMQGAVLFNEQRNTAIYKKPFRGFTKA